jgi:hypothetical protein
VPHRHAEIGLLRRVALLAGLLALPSGNAHGAPLRPGSPVLSLELEGQLVQPGGTQTRGGGAAIGGEVRLSDQLSAIASVSGLALGSGAAGTVGVGLRAWLDLTPVAPFVEVQIVDLLPPAAIGYQLATRLGAGADWRISPNVSLGLALRALAPVDPTPIVANPTGGLELALRLVIRR